MTKNIIRALFIDADGSLTQTFLQSARDLFGESLVHRSLASATSDLEKKRPQLVFVNLNLEERTKNIESIERYVYPSGYRPILFGMCDNVAPNLVAHAMENGFADVFGRPFDKDFIVTKIQRYQKLEAAIESQLQFVRIAPALEARINFQLSLASVDENGIVFNSRAFINKGTILSSSDPFLKEIFGTEKTDLIVTKSWVEPDGSFSSFVEVLNQSTASHGALRNFILTKIGGT